MCTPPDQAGNVRFVLKTMRSLSGELGCETYHLFHPKLPPIFSNQLVRGEEDRRKLARWATGSEMPDLYDRAFCVTELMPRNSFAQAIQSGGEQTSSPNVSFESGPSGQGAPFDPPHAQVETQADKCPTTQVVPDDEAAEMARQEENGMPPDESEGMRILTRHQERFRNAFAR